jgi:DNA-binding response OmpR family regulator
VPEIRVASSDVVLLDVNLPGCSGFEVCRLIKADPETAGAIVVTAMAQPADRKFGAEAGADDYLPKPFSPAVLLKKLNEIAARLEAA